MYLIFILNLKQTLITIILSWSDDFNFLVCFFLKHFFLHLFQIRRIAIVIFSVASGRLGLGEVKRMLNGEKKNWPLGLDMADPNGLYLGNHHVFLDSWVDCGDQRTWKLVDYKIFNKLTSGNSIQIQSTTAKKQCKNLMNSWIG